MILIIILIIIINNNNSVLKVPKVQRQKQHISIKKRNWPSSDVCQAQIRQIKLRKDLRSFEVPQNKMLRS